MKEVIKQKFKESFDYLNENTTLFKNKKAFAEIMGITPQFLSQLLNDNTPIPLEFLSTYFTRFPVNPGFFFKGESNILIQNAPMGTPYGYSNFDINSPNNNSGNYAHSTASSPPASPPKQGASYNMNIHKSAAGVNRDISTSSINGSHISAPYERAAANYASSLKDPIDLRSLKESLERLSAAHQDLMNVILQFVDQQNRRESI